MDGGRCAICGFGAIGRVSALGGDYLNEKWVIVKGNEKVILSVRRVIMNHVLLVNFLSYE